MTILFAIKNAILINFCKSQDAGSTHNNIKATHLDIKKRVTKMSPSPIEV